MSESQNDPAVNKGSESKAEPPSTSASNSATEGGLELGSLQSQTEESPSRVPMYVGAAVILVVLTLFVLMSLGKKDQGGEQAGLAAPDPYASSLVISDLRMSTAENFTGASVTYVDGKIENKGTRTISSATLQVGFYNQLNELVQKESMPLMIISAREPYVDTAPLNTAPLKPGDSREFRLTFEHISADWNRNYPEVRVIHVVG